jgi:anti-sigma regulatory factor (Ser/Thr protein kinase)
MDASPSGLMRWQRRQPVRRRKLPRPGGRWRPGSHSAVRLGLEAELPAAPESAGTARRLARELLADWGLAARTDDVLLVISELAANAITASRDRDRAAVAMWLVRTADGVLLAVGDPAPADGLLPSLRLGPAGPASGASEAGNPAALAEHGRGLAIAAAVADGIGWYRAGRWTVVWAEFRGPADGGGGGAADRDPAGAAAAACAA